MSGGGEGILIDREDFIVGQHRCCPIIIVRQIHSEHQWRREHCPHGVKGHLLVFGETSPAVGAGGAAADGDVAEGDHVGVRPVVGPALSLPARQQIELVIEQRPAIPDVVGDSPEVGVGFDVLGLRDGGVAGRGAEDDGAATLLDGAVNRFNFVGGIRLREIIDLDVVDAPACVLADDRVIPRLTGGDGTVHAEHIGIPEAGALGVGGVFGVIRGGAFDGGIFLDGFTRDAAHNMDAELQSHRVDLVGEGFESLTVGRGGKSIGGGHQAAEFILWDKAAGRRSFQIAGMRAGVVPSIIDDDVIPAVGEEIRLEPLRVGDHFGFGDGIAEGVVTVPAHRGSWGERFCRIGLW